MSGLSLTLFWADDELEALWSAPADTPAFRKPHAASRPSAAKWRHRTLPPCTGEAATTASQRLARLAALMLGAAAEVVHEHEA